MFSKLYSNGPLNKLSSMVIWSGIQSIMRLLKHATVSIPQPEVVSMSKKYLPMSRQRKCYRTGFELKSCVHTNQSDFMTSEKPWLYSQIPWAEFYVSSNNTWHWICYRGVRTFWASCTAWDWEIRTLYHLRCAKVKSQTKNKVMVQEWVNYLFSLIHYFWNDKIHKKF